MGHGSIGGWVFQQRRRPCEKMCLLLRARQLHGPRRHGLGPLGLPSQDKHRLAQGGGLLLKPAGVGHHQVARGPSGCASRRPSRGAMRWTLARPSRYRWAALLHHRGQVDRVDQLHLRRRPPASRRRAVMICSMGCPVVFPPVAGHQDHLFRLVIVQLIEQSGVKSNNPLHTVVLRASITVFPVTNTPVADPLPPPGSAGWLWVGQKWRSAMSAHQRPVHLLRKGRVLVIGPQSRLHMAHRDLVVKGGQSPGKGGGGIPMDQHQVGLDLARTLPPCPAGTWW